MSAEEEVEKLAIAMGKGQFRARFSHDPDGAMDSEGIDASQIPADFINTLKTLSHGELNVIAHTTGTLRDKGMQNEPSIMMMPL